MTIHRHPRRKGARRPTRRLVRFHGADIRYVAQFNAWYIWEGHRWRRDEDGAIMRLAKSAVDKLFDEAANIEDETLRTAMRKFALASQSCARLTAMVKLAESELPIVLAHERLDADPMLLGVKKGVMELGTGKFRDGRCEDYITKQCNVAYDSDAPCPEWLAFQKKITNGNDELIAYKRRLFGLLLTGMVVEILDGANGKSTELETIHELLGDYAHAADASLLISAKERGGATPEIVALNGKRALFINETNESDHLNESRVKYLAGDDMLSARDLFEKPINFRPTHKPLLRTNHKPKIRGTDLGIWRRIHYVPYLVTIAEGEKIFQFRQKKLAPELPGILNWCLAGLKDYLTQGDLKPPPLVSDATREYRQEMDTVGQWIDRICEPSLIGAHLFLKEIHEAYAKWAMAEISWVASKQKLAEELRQRGYQEDHPRNLTRFRNIRLKDDDSDG
jgi:putative DNA primase/helicase